MGWSRRSFPDDRLSPHDAEAIANTHDVPIATVEAVADALEEN